MRRIDCWQLQVLQVAALVLTLGLTITGVFGQAGTPASVLQVITLDDLKKEAEKAPRPIAGLYRFLATPADKVVLTDGGEFWVVPLPQFLGSRPSVPGKLELTVIADAGKEKKIAGSDLRSVTPFEHFALLKISELLGKGANMADDLPALTKLQAADKALQALAWFHDGTRHHPSEGASPWIEFHDRIYRQLKKVRADQLGLLAETATKDDDWAAAVSFADRLAVLYPDDGIVGHQLREFWTGYGLRKIARADYGAARKLLTRMERQYVRSPEAQPLQEKLRVRAQKLAEEAQKLPDREAEERLNEALSLWPRLPGARDALVGRRKQHHVLYVGVRRLPEFLSPATAWTDAETQAVELLFEALVQPRYRPELGQRYEAGLAERLPDAAPLFRHVELRRDAYWSDGERVTSADVRHTVQLTLDRLASWRDLIQAPRVDQESFAVDFRFSQGYLDPPALLSFKVMPQNYGGKTLVRADDPQFARAPVGSGPYVFAGLKKENGRAVAVFSANPQYIRAPQPSIREIRMFTWQQPVTDPVASEARAALLLDVPTEQLQTIKARGPGNIRSALERRVYFLALNHRVPVLGDADLRRALAHAIDREKILDDHFRGVPPELHVLEALAPALAVPLRHLGEKRSEFHHALNGLYPADCWAYCPPPRVSASLYDSGRAKALFRALNKLAPLKLTLKHPDDDPRVEAACRSICVQVQKLAAEAGSKIQLQPLALPPHTLKQAVARHDYDLAYYHLDYDNEDYWIWPLFDPHPDALLPGGTNFLGYENDAKLQALFRTAMSHRDFPTVRDVTHGVHAHLTLHMPLIPLWQLHRHMLMPANLDIGHLEPLRLFRHVAEWKSTP